MLHGVRQGHSEGVYKSYGLHRDLHRGYRGVYLDMELDPHEIKTSQSCGLRI